MVDKLLNFIPKWRRILLGSKLTDGLLMKLFLYLMLSAIGYIFLFPIFYMFSNSLKDIDDLLNPMVIWIPSKIFTQNYELAFKTLNFFPTLINSLKVTLIPALFQTLIASFIGYGFARFRFPFKKFLLVLILFSYIIPAQVTMIPKYMLFNEYQLTGKAISIILPALLGQGLNSAIFILIFYQFFRMLPKSLDEAALLDGANRYYIFFKIAVPLSIPAYITSFLFSFVWYWNETYISSIFLGSSVSTLQHNLVGFTATYESLSSTAQGFFSINEGIKNAGTLLVILPMLIIYFILQRWFVEAIDKTGVTGE